MPTSDIGLDKTLADLGVTQPEQVALRFAKIRVHFQEHFQTVHDESEWKSFRDRWLGRKSAIEARCWSFSQRTSRPRGITNRSPPRGHRIWGGRIRPRSRAR